AEPASSARQMSPRTLDSAMRKVAFALSAEAHGLLGQLLVPGATAQRAAYLDALLLRVVPFAVAAYQLRRIEIAVAVVDDRGRRSVLEFEISHVVARRRALGHELARHRAHAAHHAAPEQPHDIALVRALAVHHASCQAQLLRHSGPQHPVRGHPGEDAAELPDLPGHDDVTHGADGRIEALRMAA